MSGRSKSPLSSIESTGSSLDMNRRRRMLRPRFAIRRRAVPFRRDPRWGGDGRRFICSVCGTEFRNSFALSGHLNVHRRPKRRRSPVRGEMINSPPQEVSHPTAVADQPAPPPPAYDPLPGAVRLDEDLWLFPGPPKNNVRLGPRPNSANNGRFPPLAPPTRNCARQLLARRASVAAEVPVPAPGQAAAADKRWASPPPHVTRAMRITALARALKLRAPAFRPVTANDALPPVLQGFDRATPIAAPAHWARITPEVEAPAIRTAASKRQLPRPVYSPVLLMPQMPPAPGPELTPGVRAPKLWPMGTNNGPASPQPGCARRMPVVPLHANGPPLTGNVQAPGPVADINGQPSPSPSPPPGFALRMTTTQKCGPKFTCHGSVKANSTSPSPPPGFTRQMKGTWAAITHEPQRPRPESPNNGPPLPPSEFTGRGMLTAQGCGPEAPRGRLTSANKGPSLKRIARAQAVPVAPPVRRPVLTPEAQPPRPAAHRRGSGLLIRRHHIDEGSVAGVNPPADWLKQECRGHAGGVKEDDDNLSGTTVSDSEIRAIHDQANQEAQNLNLNLQMGPNEWQKH